MADLLKNLIVTHEGFCLPRPDETGPRIERYTAYRDFQGRAVPLSVVRCVECGGTKITQP